MLSREAAIKRARLVWPAVDVEPEQAGAAWLFRVSADVVHRLDAAGRVVCHPHCTRLDEMRTRDVIAGRWLRLRHVLQARLGLPDRVDVLDAAGRSIGSITATEGAIVVVAARGGAIAVVPAPGAAVELRFPEA